MDRAVSRSLSVMFVLAVDAEMCTAFDTFTRGLCSAGPWTSLNGNVIKQKLRKHEQGRKHTNKLSLYNQGYDAYLCEKEEADEREHARVCQVIEGRLHVERCHIRVFVLTFAQKSWDKGGCLHSR
eukprot:7388645-Prymnesium_polylepis.1